MIRYFILAIILVAPAFAVTLSVADGDVVDLGNITLNPYGMVKGAISFKLGSTFWYPQEIWLLPPGTQPESFKSTTKTLEFGSRCTTRIYSNNETYAFKITESQIANGSFCALVYGGTYEILVK